MRSLIAIGLLWWIFLFSDKNLTEPIICLWFLVPLEIFSLIRRQHHYQWRAANFDLCSALIAIEHWGIFNVPHLLWHWPTLYNGHIRGPVKLAFGCGAVTNCLMTCVFHIPESNPDLRMQGKALPLCHPSSQCQVIFTKKRMLGKEKTNCKFHYSLLQVP